jgi:hypothetical protein
MTKPTAPVTSIQFPKCLLDDAHANFRGEAAGPPTFIDYAGTRTLSVASAILSQINVECPGLDELSSDTKRKGRGRR